MAAVYAHISVSLDGFVTGPNESVGNGLGDGGERLHDWSFEARTEADAEIEEGIYARTGAVVIGRRMFDMGVEPWGDPPPFARPVFVVTHEQRDSMPMKGGTTYHFVSGGIEAGLELARAAAGERDVGIWGGADVIRQSLEAGLLDELQLHLVPIVLGGGVRLFEGFGGPGVELEKAGVVDTPRATHLRYRALDPDRGPDGG